MRRRAGTFALLGIGAAATIALLTVALPRRGVWFNGDFETGGLDGWAWDIARRDSAEVVTEPVRKGRYAVRITLAPGDRAASKERAELKIADKTLERAHGHQGHDIWYGWSLFIPNEYADPPAGHWQILGQWHHRPIQYAQGERPRLIGPPPLAVYLASHQGRDHLLLIGQKSPKAPPRRLGMRPVSRGNWIDLVFHIRCSTGSNGFVEAWLDGRPFTEGKMAGPTLYSPDSNYLRLGLYRPKGVQTTNHVFYDEVRIGESYRAVAP
ncbi:MAG TPA: polysaccharide lyase [Thermoanaerobaculia bacterium]|nr:polysaccharide lyase [Thermoanaerobaculia bacterium]